jgi:hypothetical protein
MQDRKRVRKRTRVAYHESGHAVLSAAISDAPHLISIRPDGATLGRCHYRPAHSLEKRVQIHLAGFAAEELLLLRRPPQMDGSDLGLSIASFVYNDAISSKCIKTCDQYLAVSDIVEMGCDRRDSAIRIEFNRFYAIAMESLKSVWPAVAAVAKTVLKKTDIDRSSFSGAIRGYDIYTPIFAIQKTHGIKLAV